MPSNLEVTVPGVVAIVGLLLLLIASAPIARTVAAYSRSTHMGSSHMRWQLLDTRFDLCQQTLTGHVTAPSGHSSCC